MDQIRSHPKEWFMIRLSSLGDVALTTGVLAYWQRAYGWTFSVITKEAFAPLFANHPAVSRIIALKDDELAFKRLVPLFRKLAAEAGNAGLIDLHGTLRSRLLSYLWRGPVHRYSKLTPQRRLFLLSRGRLFRRRLNTWNVPQRYARAIESAPPARTELLPHIALCQEEKDWGKARLAAIRERDAARPLVAIHPYAAHPDKAWMPEAWQALVAKLDAAHIHWFVIGRAADAERLPAIPPEQDFTNTTSLRETCALLGEADALITGDSGPMHLAAGVATPVTAIFGPTTPEWGFAPAGPKDQIVQVEQDCRPCSLHGGKACARKRACMRAVTPDMVMKALLRCLA